MTRKQQKALKCFGDIKVCKIVNDTVVIVITKGFSDNSIQTITFLGCITKTFPDHPIVETLITENDLAIVILKRSIAADKKDPVKVHITS